ncbi:MAG TPA: hypothetical protein DCL35_02675 [Candidatus Omnitrophica bacterium]|nr:hypothetical protein [Candidatus Omnitrophota bacterium]
MNLTTHKRTINRIEEGVTRKDPLFDEIARYYFFDKKKFTAVHKSIQAWLKKHKTEEAHALAGYASYLDGDFKGSTRFFLKTVAANPDNLDNWMDLAFSLRHQGEIAMSYTILFHFDLAIHYYKRLRLRTGDLKQFKKMLSLILSHAK